MSCGRTVLLTTHFCPALGLGVAQGDVRSKDGGQTALHRLLTSEGVSKLREP
jgi:hypothetical protein